MSEVINLAGKMAQQLPAELVGFIRRAGEVAAEQGQTLYLVGGVVRDLLLRRGNFDLDLVVEGDALKLAPHLADISQGKIITHPRFSTAKIRWQKWSVDLATARSETYTQPGALPSVQPGAIDVDLCRRDFTINTMAVALIPERYGQLIDPYQGMADLEHKLIRVLHPRSFIDDATRIWRGLRYEQRLNFHLEANTLQLLERDIPLLETISGDRMRHELELVLKEEFPEKVLRRAEKLKVLPKLHPSLKGDGWLTEKFGQARSVSLALSALYLALLAYRLTDEEHEQLISRLRLPKSLAQTLRDSNSLKAKLGALAKSDIVPSIIYSLLHGYSQSAITANYLASTSPVTQQHIRLFLDKLRYVKSSLTGKDLQRMGITSGPRMKEILQRLHEARLDGKVRTKKGEEELVRGWLGHKDKSRWVRKVLAWLFGVLGGWWAIWGILFVIIGPRNDPDISPGLALAMATATNFAPSALFLLLSYLLFGRPPLRTKGFFTSRVIRDLIIGIIAGVIAGLLLHFIGLSPLRR